MSLAVVAGYTLAWLPFNLMVLVGFDRISWYPQYVFFACHSLAMAHSTYNPVIYAWMNVKFRSAFLSVLSRLNLPCPCARNSDLNSTNQFPYNTTYSHHSIYVRQQIYGGDQGQGSNKHLLQQQQQKQDSNRTASQLSKQRSYQVANGSVKSSLDSDPLVLITIPTHQLDTAKNRKGVLNGASKEGGSKQPSPEPLNNVKHCRSSTTPDPNCIIPSNNNGSSPSTPRSQLIVPKKLSPIPPSPVDIMATAKEEDLLDDDDDDSEVESPVWT